MRAWAESLEQWAGPGRTPVLGRQAFMPSVMTPNHQGRQQGTSPQGVTRRLKEGPQASGQGCMTLGTVPTRARELRLVGRMRACMAEPGSAPFVCPLRPGRGQAGWPTGTVGRPHSLEDLPSHRLLSAPAAQVHPEGHDRRPGPLCRQLLGLLWTQRHPGDSRGGFSDVVPEASLGHPPLHTPRSSRSHTWAVTFATSDLEPRAAAEALRKGWPSQDHTGSWPQICGPHAGPRGVLTPAPLNPRTLARPHGLAYTPALRTPSPCSPRPSTDVGRRLPGWGCTRGAAWAGAGVRASPGARGQGRGQVALEPMQLGGRRGGVTGLLAAPCSLPRLRGQCGRVFLQPCDRDVSALGHHPQDPGQTPGGGRVPIPW